MSGQPVKSAFSGKRLLVRSCLALAYVVLIGVFFLFGKTHTLLIDNKAQDDGALEAIDGILVSVNGREALELYAGDRDMVLLKGQKHRIRVESITGESLVETTSFRLPLDTDMLILSVPKLVADREPYIETFVPRDQPRPAGEEIGNTNSFTSPGGEDAPTVPPAQ